MRTRRPFEGPLGEKQVAWLRQHMPPFVEAEKAWRDSRKATTEPVANTNETPDPNEAA